MEIAEENHNKAAFASHHRLLKVTRLPFGLKNAPGTSQQAMDVRITKIRLQFAVVYLDYFFMFLLTADEHFDHVRQELTLL